MALWIAVGLMAGLVAVVAGLVRLRQLLRRRTDPAAPHHRAGSWLVSNLSFAPLLAAGVVALYTPVPPLTTDRRDALLLLAGIGAGWLAFAAYGLLERASQRPGSRAVLAVVQALLGTVAILAAGVGGFMLGRVEAQSPIVVLIGIAVLACAMFVLASAGIPLLHPGVNGGIGANTVPFLGLFGVLAVPVLSDRTEFIATKADGWWGVGVLVVLVGVISYAMSSLQKLGDYLATGRLPRRVASVRSLTIVTAGLFGAAIWLAVQFRR
jgi:hypothetical protein